MSTNTYWINRFGIPRGEPTTQAIELLVKYGIRNTGDIKSLSFTEFWDLVCRDPSRGFDTPREGLITEQGRLSIQWCSEAYDSCCCQHACSNNFTVTDTKTGRCIDPVGSKCIGRFNIEAGATAERHCLEKKLQDRIDRYGIRKISIDDNRHICRICQKWLVGMNRKYGKTHQICDRCIIKAHHKVLPEHIEIKPLKSVRTSGWEIQNGQRLPWFISCRLDKDGDLYFYNHELNDTFRIKDNYCPRLDYNPSDKTWLWKIKQLVTPTDLSDTDADADDNYDIVTYNGVDTTCKICEVSFYSTAMIQNIMLTSSDTTIQGESQICKHCQYRSPHMVDCVINSRVPEFRDTPKILYSQNKYDFKKFQSTVTYSGNKCKTCDHLLTIRVSKSEHNPGRRMNWCKSCEKVSGGFKGWVNTSDNCKNPYDKHEVYKIILDEFIHYLKDPGYFKSQCKKYLIKRSERKQIEKSLT